MGMPLARLLTTICMLACWPAASATPAMDAFPTRQTRSQSIEVRTNEIMDIPREVVAMGVYKAFPDTALGPRQLLLVHHAVR